jgi:hypothetical protein
VIGREPLDRLPVDNLDVPAITDSDEAVSGETQKCAAHGRQRHASCSVEGNVSITSNPAPMSHVRRRENAHANSRLPPGALPVILMVAGPWLAKRVVLVTHGVVVTRLGRACAFRRNQVRLFHPSRDSGRGDCSAINALDRHRLHQRQSAMWFRYG